MLLRILRRVAPGAATATSSSFINGISGAMPSISACTITALQLPGCSQGALPGISSREAWRSGCMPTTASKRSCSTMARAGPCCRIVTRTGGDELRLADSGGAPHGRCAVAELHAPRAGPARIRVRRGSWTISPQSAVDRDGIWRVDLRRARPELVVSLEDLLEVDPRREMGEAAHQVNHAVYSPVASGSCSCIAGWAGGNVLAAVLRGSRRFGLQAAARLIEWCRTTPGATTHTARVGSTPEGGDRYYLLDVSTGTARCAARRRWISSVTAILRFPRTVSGS